MEEDLKKRCKALETTIHLQKQYTGATINRAKQIIEGLLDAFPNPYSDVVKDKLDEARQFLTETEMVLNYFL